MTVDEAILWLEANQGVQLISSDNGYWAVSLSGFQDVPFEDPPASTMYFEAVVEPDEWHKTIVEAVQHAKQRESV